LFNPVGVFAILYFITTGCTRGYGCSTLSGLGEVDLITIRHKQAVLLLLTIYLSFIFAKEQTA
jgi:hypothetical protein